MQGLLDECVFGFFCLVFVLHLRRNSRWPPKMVGKQFLGKDASRYPMGQNSIEINLSHTVSEINAFLRFTQ